MAPAQTCALGPPKVKVGDLVAEHCPRFGVPVALALAVIEVESRGHPNAINVSVGRGYSLFPSSRAEAVLLLDQLAKETLELGIGLMQIHYRYHKNRFGVSPQDLLEPATNIRIGCELLGEALRAPGSLSDRIGRYNAKSHPKRQRYAKRILIALEAR